MKKNASLQKKLQEILSRRCFEDLEPFRNRTSWKALGTEERHLLASLFVMQGEKQLASGDDNALESFDIAAQVSPDNAEVLFRIGCAFANREDSLEHLQLAKTWIEKCLKLSPESFNARLALANLLNTLGFITREIEYLQEGSQHFEQALEEGKDLDETTISHIYWKWAVCGYQMGKISGEAVDFHLSIEKFRLAAEKKLDNLEFWNAYGDSFAELACLLGRNDLFLEVVEIYRKGLRHAFDSFEGWLNLGCAFQRLFEFNYLEEYFIQADECFKMASQIDNSNSLLWLKWAELFSFNGKLRRNVESLNLSFEKFQKAAECEPDEALILSFWGEALMLYGAHTENVDFIREAQRKIILSIELNPKLAETWYFYGCSLNELGRYFCEERFYHEAIEKFQHGIQIKSHEPLLWYGLALSHFAIGELREDAIWLEKASHLCSRVLEKGGQNFRQFWNDWGVTLMKLAELTGDKVHVEAAIEKFEQALSVEKDSLEFAEADPEWLYNYGCALDFLGDFTENISCYEKAIQVLERVLEIDPNYHHARYNLALAYAHLGELVMDVESFHKSIEQFQLLLTQDREDEMSWNDFGVTLIHLSQLIHDSSRPEQTHKMQEIAESKLLHAASLGCIQAYYNIACLYSLMGHFPASIHFLEKASQVQALPALEDMMNDEWLEGVRATLEFQEFVNDSFGHQIPEY
jgi:tetratricopeptide (TPR) repeat protein